MKNNSIDNSKLAGYILVMLKILDTKHKDKLKEDLNKLFSKKSDKISLEYYGVSKSFEEMLQILDKHYQAIKPK